jgi:hypothetical protein
VGLGSDRRQSADTVEKLAVEILIFVCNQDFGKGVSLFFDHHRLDDGSCWVSGYFYAMRAHLSCDLVAVEHTVWQAGVDFVPPLRVNIRR